MAAPRTATFVALDAGSIQWASGTLFDGFLLVTITLPSSWTTAYAAGMVSKLRIPLITTIPIIAGVLDSNVGVFFNDDINPPGTVYTIKLYDLAGNLIHSYGTRTISASPQTMIIGQWPIPT